MVSDRTAGAPRTRTVSVRRWALLAAGLGLGCSVWAGGPTAAQGDPIDQSRDLSTQSMPRLPVPAQPTERLVPESRRRDPLTGQDKVISPHYERATTGRPEAPPPIGYDPPGQRAPHIPGR